MYSCETAETFLLDNPDESDELEDPLLEETMAEHQQALQNESSVKGLEHVLTHIEDIASEEYAKMTRCRWIPTWPHRNVTVSFQSFRN